MLTRIAGGRKQKQAVWRRKDAFISNPTGKRKDEVSPCAVANEDDFASKMRRLFRHTCVDLVVLPLKLRSLPEVGVVDS